MATGTLKAPKGKPDAIAKAIDELLKLQKALAPFRKRIAREEALKKLIRGAASFPADESGIIHGIDAEAHLGACGNETKVNVEKLYSLLSARAFVPLASVTLKKLEEAEIAPEVRAQVLTTTQTGSRSLVIVPKG